MSLHVSEKSGTSRPLTPAGTHLARCYQLIDLGTQDEEYMGKPKVQAKVRIGWELPNEQAVFVEEKGPQPFAIWKEYTASLGDKANLRHDLEAWRGRPFTEAELKGFDLKNIVGKACLVTVMHQRSRDGKKTYDKVANVSALPKDPATQKPIAVPAAINAPVIYDIEDGRNNVFNDLPDWLQEKIAGSHEFREGSTAAGTESASDLDGMPEIPF